MTRGYIGKCSYTIFPGTGNRPAAASLLVACGNNLALCLMSLERWDAAGKALVDVLAIDCNNVKATERHIKVLANQHEFAQVCVIIFQANHRGDSIIAGAVPL